MIGSGQYDDLATTVSAIGIILSVLISLVLRSARRLAVEEQRASSQDLCELTGIDDPGELQDTFGPPALQTRLWHNVTLEDVERERRPLAYLIANDWLDYACGAIALISFFWREPLVYLFLWAAIAAQVGGWVASARLPR